MLIVTRRHLWSGSTQVEEVLRRAFDDVLVTPAQLVVADFLAAHEFGSDAVAQRFRQVAGGRPWRGSAGLTVADVLGELHRLA